METLLDRLHRLPHPLPPAIADALADELSLRRGAVAEFVSFYSAFGIPQDAVRVCTGPLCGCLGAEPPAGAVASPCLGHCDLAPVQLHGETVVPPVVHRTNLALEEQPFARVPAPGRVLAELDAAGLRGYGGAGFPTASKWRAVLAEPGPRVVVVNADEGEPGTFKDRYLLELRPRLVVEGALIAMQTLGADEGFVYLREEYATARGRLTEALDGIDNLRIVVGGGSYVCGEETALLESMEGRRGMPRLRPPYPAQRGLFGRPTLVQNVETLAWVAEIVRRGGAWYAGAGQPRLWSVSGCVAEPGCYEAPGGISPRRLIEEYAGGATEEIGAFVPGGAAAGLLPPSELDQPLAGGSGALTVFPARIPIRAILERTMAFFAEESCQKCTPCRIGTRALRDVAAGERRLPRLEDWLLAMEQGSICGLGQSAPKPVRDVLRFWPEALA